MLLMSHEHNFLPLAGHISEKKTPGAASNSFDDAPHGVTSCEIPLRVIAMG
uniref:Uncharacterized protein n=1 Tax=Anguilla anguilla TaxID=7936 RepID=A0A0E9Q2B8_ANGAN